MASVAPSYLLAAAACQALERLLTTRVVSEARLSLARTARCLMDAGEHGDVRGPDFGTDDARPFLEFEHSAFGPLRRVRYPGAIEGVTPSFVHPSGPLATHAARW